MYPVFRLFTQLARHRNDPPLGLTDTHVSRHICWPWDLDIWWELNNGRALTLYDLGRLPMARRIGLTDALKREGWGLTVAGSTTRYRRRVRVFDRIEMRSRGVGWDARFLYVEQSMWTSGGDCAGHVLIRSAIVGKDGIVPPARALEAMGYTGPDLPPPPWVAAWIAAEEQRPWPPMTNSE
ncbi:acyl-CoA thioesterase [Histidinibacterium lentulum]|uniref:Acyl-CoA thioesterase n=1 Tax=Histidinibacterium lentulum TaxID=2480588 RepID=A0A3N2R1L0_9RHOB|nr:acyl-CoA thioesterase [Histidinibacterium lentulum]ROU01228.1 acyl-CoA thioesterase [Histidinibacterium lentulum]